MRLTTLIMYLLVACGIQASIPSSALSADSAPIQTPTQLEDGNATLARQLRFIAGQKAKLDRELASSEGLLRRIQADFSDARATLKTVGGLGEGLGPLLRQHHTSLPDIEQYSERAEQRSNTIAKIGVRRMVQRENLRQFVDTGLTTSPAVQEPQLRQLLAERKTLLTQSLQENKAYLGQLQQIDVIESELIAVVNEYDAFLQQHLWWLRGAAPVRLDDVRTLADNVYHWFSTSSGSESLLLAARRLFQSTTFWLTVLFTGAILWNRRRLSRHIQTCAENLGRISTDRLIYTVKAFVLTLIAALPLPLLMFCLGWQLSAEEFKLFSGQLPDKSLFHLTGFLYALQVFHWACIPRGLADAHFLWRASGLSRVRRELTRLSWIFMPTALGIWLLYTQQSADGLGIVSRLGFILFQCSLAVSLYTLAHRERGVLANSLQHYIGKPVYRVYPLIFWFIVLLPLWLGLEILAGYVHSSIATSRMLLNTLALGIVLILLYSFARRWLLSVHRRLAYEAALERRKNELAAREAKAAGDEPQTGAEFLLDEPEINLTELSDDTRGLVRLVTLTCAVAGLYLIWQPLFPALRIFENVNLWHQTVTVDGQTTQMTTTLADIGRALLIVVITAVLANRLPSTLKIILMQRAGVSDGDRYTLTKLTTYAVFATGGLLALNTLGAKWSQLQWLVAALGVGIGFGLQEIVANFISGLIILFERPIRIGDVITIDGTSGVVTKIRIRATTIRDWDRKELLVPNKDLITGRVLNWSLSDEMTRIVITVGIAYSSDVDKALALMKKAADEHEHALDDPAPLLSFDSFGDNALTLTMRVYVGEISQRINTVTDLRIAINRKFQEAGISIAYPQRDIHFDRDEPIRVTVENSQQSIQST